MNWYILELLPRIFWATGTGLVALLISAFSFGGFYISFIFLKLAIETLKGNV